MQNVWNVFLPEQWSFSVFDHSCTMKCWSSRTPFYGQLTRIMVTLLKKGRNCLPNNRSVSFEALSTCYQRINVNCWSKWINCQRVSTAHAFRKSGIHCTTYIVFFRSKAHFRCRGKAYLACTAKPLIYTRI